MARCGCLSLLTKSASATSERRCIMGCKPPSEPRLIQESTKRLPHSLSTQSLVFHSPVQASLFLGVGVFRMLPGLPISRRRRNLLLPPGQTLNCLSAHTVSRLARVPERALRLFPSSARESGGTEPPALGSEADHHLSLLRRLHPNLRRYDRPPPLSPLHQDSERWTGHTGKRSQTVFNSPV